jgi:ABC-type sulfate transport system permease component
VLGVMMLAVSFMIMLAANALQHWSNKRLGF